MPWLEKAANPFHSLAALQKLAHHASYLSARALAFAFPATATIAHNEPTLFLGSESHRFNLRTKSNLV